MRQPICAPQLGIGDSAIEAHFARDARALKLPAWLRNYRFLLPRKFELDFAWPNLKFGVEIDGHVHRIRDRFDTDREKGALALLAGWSVLHVTGLHVRSGAAVEWTRQAIALFSRPGDAPDCPPHRLAHADEARYRTAPITASELAYGPQE